MVTMVTTSNGASPKTLYIGTLVFQVAVVVCRITSREEAGCADSKTEQHLINPSIRACSGQWQGHISNSSNLCAPGWRVCGWYDEHLLKNISWKEALSIKGCYAINAAQDGGECRECKDDLEQDDLAGIGRSCPHQDIGQGSCISGGKIDVSCCVDSYYHKACRYQPELDISGVLCCKIPGIPPRLLVAPHEEISVQKGLIVVLTCQAVGTPHPKIKWLKNGHPLPKNISRIIELESGDLVISLAEPSDSGVYTCLAKNTEGLLTVHSMVTVTDVQSGCADGTTEGLHRFLDVHACRGSWEGHVKNAGSVCSHGWTVCSPRDRDFLEWIKWSDIKDIHGCYAYNAANKKMTCTRCRKHNMAGIGLGCGRVHRHDRLIPGLSCLVESRIDVYKSKSHSGCVYRDGLTTGVVCCRKRKKRKEKDPSLDLNTPLSCSPECKNGGLCVGTNRCQCAIGYKGAWCQHAMCKNCGPNAKCVEPGVCKCKKGFSGKRCRRKHKCRKLCFNGGRCRHGKCKCPTAFWGEQCQHIKNISSWFNNNKTER